MAKSWGESCQHPAPRTPEQDSSHLVNDAKRQPTVAANKIDRTSRALDNSLRQARQTIADQGGPVP